jgi:hypothetical protein
MKLPAGVFHVGSFYAQIEFLSEQSLVQDEYCMVFLEDKLGVQFSFQPSMEEPDFL